VPGEAAAPAPAAREKKHAKSELPAEHVVVVRVYDRFENMGAAKIVVRQGGK
jgi:hypothetical protein